MVSKSAQEKALDRLEAICRERGGRLTRLRRAVVAKLLAAGRPLSAYRLLDLLRPEDGSSAPINVYRSLDFLVEQGLVHRLETTRSFVACEHPDRPHPVQFLICRQCGMVVETADKGVAAATESLGRRLGFVLDQETVELTGLCENCRGEDVSS
jgi:Fur family transcriptional regulator, zinc uptake regulator